MKGGAMTETVRGSRWTLKVCQSCGGKRVMRSSDVQCGWCKAGGRPRPRYEPKVERVAVPGMGRVMDEKGVRVADLAGEIRMSSQSLGFYRRGQRKPTHAVAKTLALYLDTTVEELRRP